MKNLFLKDKELRPNNIMNYQTYKKNLVRIALCLIGILMADALGYLRDDSGYSWISTICFFSYRILFLYLLCFSIYAALSRVKDVRMLEQPMIFVIFGFLMVTLTFGYPIAIYQVKSNIKNVKFYAYDATQLEEIRQSAINMNTASSGRYYSAERYFLSTGEIIPYLNNQNKKVSYDPSEHANKIRETNLKTNLLLDSLERKLKNDKIMVFGLIVLLVFFAAGFLTFLWYRFYDT